ncbi:hypothetical protein OESDEN_20783 [Oesophagostomum dentatum]|nr:hypothetical protein OESDEN_20783 [Oesophagostomum dentatum]
MQYGPYAFAVDEDKYTIRALYSEYQNAMGQREAPAFSDVRMMNRLYNCSMNCMNTAVPPCRHSGYQDPRNCNRCKCPRMFSGTYCEKLSSGSATNCNGRVVQARTRWWSTLKGTAGDPDDWKLHDTPADCYWHITAPAGRRIQVRLSTPPNYCMEQCPVQAIELNIGHFDMYGMIMCCQSATWRTYTSLSNMVTIRGTVRYKQLTFDLDYRLV